MMQTGTMQVKAMPLQIICLAAFFCICAKQVRKQNDKIKLLDEADVPPACRGLTHLSQTLQCQISEGWLRKEFEQYLY